MKAEWPLTQLGAVLHERKESPSATDLEAGTVAIVSKIAFDTGQIALRADRTTKTNMILARPGDLLLSGINASKGAIALYPPDAGGPVAATIHYAAYEVKTERALPEYLWWYLRSGAFRDLLKQSLPEGIKTELKAARLLPLQVPMPAIPEQRRIVARIEALAGKIEEAKRLRQLAVDEAEGGVLTSHLHRLFGDYYAGVDGILGGLEWVRLDSVVTDVADGPHVTPAYTEEGIPFVTALNVTPSGVTFQGAKFISPADHAQYQKRAIAEQGDVLVTKDGTIGRSCVIDADRDFSFFVSVALVKPQRGVLSGAYLAWVLRVPCLQARITERSRGDMIRHLVLREIRDLTIPLLPLGAQMAVVEHLDTLQAQVDTLMRLQSEAAAELDALLPSVLDRAFRGEL